MPLEIEKKHYQALRQAILAKAALINQTANALAEIDLAMRFGASGAE